MFIPKKAIPGPRCEVRQQVGLAWRWTERPAGCYCRDISDADSRSKQNYDIYLFVLASTKNTWPMIFFREPCCYVHYWPVRLATMWMKNRCWNEWTFFKPLFIVTLQRIMLTWRS